MVVWLVRLHIGALIFVCLCNAAFCCAGLFACGCLSGLTVVW